MNRIKRSRALDTHNVTEHNAFSSNGIKERQCPVDRFQTLRANLHQKIDHSSERLIKLTPYPILDTDPTLDDLNFSNKLSRSRHSIGKIINR
jgi:tubulin polyglutamylase TTLL4